MPYLHRVSPVLVSEMRSCAYLYCNVDVFFNEPAGRYHDYIALTDGEYLSFLDYLVHPIFSRSGHYTSVLEQLGPFAFFISRNW